MPLTYLPFLMYSTILDVMFQQWGSRPSRATIIAHEPTQLALPAPKHHSSGGI